MTSLSQGGGGENFVSTLLKRQKQKACVWCGGSQIFCDALNKILILRNILMQFQHSKITSTKKTNQNSNSLSLRSTLFAVSAMYERFAPIKVFSEDETERGFEQPFAVTSFIATDVNKKGLRATLKEKCDVIVDSSFLLCENVHRNKMRNKKIVDELFLR